MSSITYRITGLMFLMTAGTVGTLLYLTNMQMSDLFQEYLLVADASGPRQSHIP